MSNPNRFSQDADSDAFEKFVLDTSYEPELFVPEIDDATIEAADILGWLNSYEQVEGKQIEPIETEIVINKNTGRTPYDDLRDGDNL